MYEFSKQSISIETFAPFLFAQASLSLCNDLQVVQNRNEEDRANAHRSHASGSGGAAALDLMCSTVVLSTVEQQALVGGLPLIHPPVNTGNDARSSSSSSSSNSSGSDASPTVWLAAIRSLLDDTHHAPAILYRILVSDTMQKYVNTTK